ncbi:MAG TPA: hypothetical protein PLP14_09640, partial [Chitinophagaceae bacterium]|nr:hypothetical protein [Chitinophagaceae bacterium]
EFYTWYCSQFPKQALVVNYTVFKKAYRQFIERPDPYLAPAIWFLRMAKDAKVKQPALFYTAAAHLCFLNDQPTGCDSILQFTRGMEMNESLRNQIRILKLCNQIHQTEKLEAETENNLLADFQWLDIIRKQKPFYQVVYRTIQRRLMYSQYLRQGDTLKALLVQMKSEQLQVSSDYSYGEGTSKFGLIYWESSGQFLNDEMSLNQCLALEQWFSHPVSAYDRWLCSEVSLTEAMLDELIARKFVQEGRFAEAVSYFHRAGDQIRVPDPFVVHILDLQDGYYEDSLHTYTLSALADTLHTLQGLQGQSLRASFDLGCALYSISYYGKCWYLQKFYRSGYEPAAYIRPSGKSLFFNLVESFRCFEKVYRQSVDPEMKSKALWMMAKIAQKNFPEPGSQSGKSTDTGQVFDYTTWAIRMNPYLDSFNRQFKGTTWYEKVYQECSYLRSFIQR